LASPKGKVPEANYVRRIAKARTRRIEKRVGKPMIYDEETMLYLLMNRKVPTMVQHCILKVKEKVKGSQHEKFISAFNICGWVFQTYGYMKKSQTSMDMTGKGIKRNRQHQREKEASAKNSKYQSLVRKLWGPSLAALKKEKPEDRPEPQKRTGRKPTYRKPN
jgi:hypothetical protein